MSLTWLGDRCRARQRTRRRHQETKLRNVIMPKFWRQHFAPKCSQVAAVIGGLTGDNVPRG